MIKTAPPIKNSSLLKKAEHKQGLEHNAAEQGSSREFFAEHGALLVGQFRVAEAAVAYVAQGKAFE